MGEWEEKNTVVIESLSPEKLAGNGQWWDKGQHMCMMSMWYESFMESRNIMMKIEWTLTKEKDTL